MDEDVLDAVELAAHRAHYTLKPFQIRDAKDWYKNNGAYLMSLGTDKVDGTSVCAVAAVLSPGVRWEGLINNMPDILKNTFYPPAYGKNNAKARQIILGAHPEYVVKGRKVWSFWKNLCGIQDVVTVDSHMLSLAFRCKKPEDRPSITKGRYNAIEKAVVIVAKKYGITPAELQAILWVYQREYV